MLIYLLMKIEQSLCREYLRSISFTQILIIIPIYILNLNISSYLLLSVLFTLAWMDDQLKAVSDRLLILYFISILFHYINHPIPISVINLFICLGLLIFSKLSNGLGIGDVYIFFGLAFILTLQDFMFVIKYSCWFGLILELIKKAKSSFAFIPYIYIGLVVFLILNLY